MVIADMAALSFYCSTGIDSPTFRHKIENKEWKNDGNRLSLNSDLFELENMDVKGIKLEVLQGSHVWNEIKLVSIQKNRIDSSEV